MHTPIDLILLYLECPLSCNKIPMLCRGYLLLPYLGYPALIKARTIRNPTNPLCCDLLLVRKNSFLLPFLNPIYINSTACLHQLLLTVYLVYIDLSDLCSMFRVSIMSHLNKNSIDSIIVIEVELLIHKEIIMLINRRNVQLANTSRVDQLLMKSSASYEIKTIQL